MHRADQTQIDTKSFFKFSFIYQLHENNLFVKNKKSNSYFCPDEIFHFILVEIFKNLSRSTLIDVDLKFQFHYFQKLLK